MSQECSVVLKELESSDYSRRMRRMVDLGKESISNPTSQAILEQLSRGSLYERHLTLQSCYGSRSVLPALEAITGPSNSARNRSIKIVSLFASPGQLAEIAPKVPLPTLRCLVKLLRRRRGPEIIHGMIKGLNDESQRELCPFGPDAYVTATLNHQLGNFGKFPWATIARRHPNIACSRLLEYLRNAPLDDPLFGETICILTSLQKQQDFFELFELLAFKGKVPWYDGSVRSLVQKYPQEIAQIILSIQEIAPVPLDKIIKRLEIGTVIALLKSRHPAIHSIQNLDPDIRGQIIKALPYSYGLQMPARICALLPAESRYAQARKQLQLPDSKVSEQHRIFFISYLPWDEAMSLQRKYLRSSDATIRGSAIQAQLGAVKFDHNRIDDALQLAIEHRFDQESIRQIVFEQLIMMSVEVWKEKHLVTLDSLYRQALDASNLGRATIHYMFRLPCFLLNKYPTWAARQIAVIVKELGKVPSHGSVHATHNPTRRRICTNALDNALAPVMETLIRKEDESLLLDLGGACVPALDSMDLLSSALGNILRSSGSEANQLRALDLLGKHRPSTVLPYLEIMLQSTTSEQLARASLEILRKEGFEIFRKLLPRLVVEDPSWLLFPIIREHIARHCQLLLTPHLGDGETPLRGRFNLSEKSLPLDFNLWMHRLTKQQQSLVADGCQKDLSSYESENIPSLQYDLKLLALMHFLSPEPVQKYTNDSRVPIRNTALRALKNCDDRNTALQILFDALGDERSRVAVYEVGHALKAVSEEEVLKLLLEVPRSKVTVFKQIVRLIADLGTERSQRTLLDLEAAKPHIDVRRVILTELLKYLHLDSTWDALLVAAQDSDSSIASQSISIPSIGLSQEQHGTLINIIGLLLAHPDSKVQGETLQRCIRDPIKDSKQELFPHVARFLSTSTDLVEIASAATAIFATYPFTISTTTEAFNIVLGRVGRTQPEGYAYLSRIIKSYQKSINDENREERSPITLAVLDLLYSRSLTTTLRIQLLISTLPIADLRTSLLSLTSLSIIHGDAINTASELD
ncbi:hypothetical protein K402DRAFT_399775 [Aulographum hederae CBS 113979]|uniref:ARM repeat-containing protein n=1 Tax=Aulographum hederae CBS 113979 TaxID=1176131 RepID=A0A6G1HF50_9PEZI|nr:hypothetical protein K402DRAFT_399775 [Aulographum hederae CBS 113979]